MIYKTLHRKIKTLQWSKEKITNYDLQNTTQKNTDIAMVKGKITNYDLQNTTQKNTDIAMVKGKNNKL
jgi:hypothetical protein